MEIFKKNQKKIFENTQNKWKKNAVERLKGVKIQYLLICEAPPCSGEYFYSGKKSKLLSIIWKTFFEDKYEVPDDAYQKLAEIGFLLIDTLPFALNYSFPKGIRSEEEYLALIVHYKDWWIKELNNNFSFELPDKLKIAFGFRKNAEAILKATNNVIILKGNEYTISDNNIVKSNILPLADSLKDMFEQKRKLW